MKITKEVFIQCKPYSWQQREEYNYIAMDSELDGYITVGSQIISVEVPDDFDFVSPQIAGLEAEKVKVRAEASAHVAAIDESIQNLKALEYIPEEE